MSHEPPELTVGQLSDDLDVITATEEPNPAETWHGLSHLIGLLRAVELAARS